MKNHSIGVFLLIAALAFALMSCAAPAPEPVPTAAPELALAPEALEPVEIREYQGEKLSSATDFSENSIAGAPDVSLDGYQLSISGLVDNPLTLSYDEVLGYDAYSKVATLFCVEGWDATVLWEGVLIEDLLADAGIQDEAAAVIFYAEDGYSSSLTLDFVRDNDIILAYKMNGVTLPADRGFPFQVVAESKWGYKWVRWVTEIQLTSNAEYKGYWEELGYNNDGNVEGPKFGE